MRIGFIGTGNMGSGMARRLIHAGHSVTVYNRTPAKLTNLRELGATVAGTPAEASTTAEILITMVSDDMALEAILWGASGALSSLPKGAIHITMSTISEKLAEKIGRAHGESGTRHVGAPVFGRPPAAADGKLFIVTAGDKSDLDVCAPVFEALGQKTIVVGDRARAAHLTKVMGNFMLFSAIEAMAEAIAHVEACGLDPAVFLEAMTSTIFTAPIYKNYGGMMVSGQFTQPGAVNLHLALKDIRLALSSAKTAGSLLPTGNLVQSHLELGIQRGYGEYDVSALTKLLNEIK